MSAKSFPTRQLGRNGPTVSAIGFGAMGIGAFYGTTDEKQAYETLTYAADRGVTFWDTSDLYGTSEAALGKWFSETGRRSEIFLASKFGAKDMDLPPDNWSPNSKPAYIKRQLAKSLAALKTDYIDLYYQHRVDPEVPIEVVLETLRPYLEKGTIRWIGLSECSIATLRRARAVPGIGEKVVAAQMEFSPFELHLEKNGFAEAAKELGVAVVAYSPLARGLATGRFKSNDDFEDSDFRKHHPRFSKENFPKNLKIVEKLQAVAEKQKSTNTIVTVAWILASHEHFIPIPGTRSPERLEELAKGAELKLSPDEVKQIREVVENADVAGARYAAEPQGDCIPVSEWKGE
ncbi:hypothetical protein HGRIS_000419 [Hohenbuehelia grisea]|uniref:NADP-dependent oxidoreductase domain-containing protein n=1 Tax=Hohenbuehelia grisea TaxID=104357 RepID=A0ABR3JRX1_9AGAR